MICGGTNSFPPTPTPNPVTVNNSPSPTCSRRAAAPPLLHLNSRPLHTMPQTSEPMPIAGAHPSKLPRCAHSNGHADGIVCCRLNPRHVTMVVHWPTPSPNNTTTRSYRSQPSVPTRSSRALPSYDVDRFDTVTSFTCTAQQAKPNQETKTLTSDVASVLCVSEPRQSWKWQLAVAARIPSHHYRPAHVR